MSVFLLFVLSLCEGADPSSGINRSNCLYQYQQCMDSVRNDYFLAVDKDDFCTKIVGDYVTKKVGFCK